MIVNVSYKEILDFVQREFNVSPVLKSVGAKCVEISYKPSPFLPEIGVTLKILGLRKDIVCLSYDCGAAANMLITGVVAYMQECRSQGKNCFPDGVLVNPVDMRVDIYPMRIKKLEKFMEFVELEDIVFDVTSVNVVFKLRD